MTAGLTKLLLAGDTHGDTSHFRYLIQTAQGLGISEIVQVGDFGFGWGQPGVVYLNKINKWADEAGIRITFIVGNHEDHPRLLRKHGPDSPSFYESEEGFWRVRSNIWHIPNGHFWNWNGLQFGAAGGAYSVDKPWRTEGISWWPEEEMTWAETDDMIKRGKQLPRLDVLLTHDKLRRAEINNDRKELFPASWANQERMQLIADELHPILNVHGHFHERHQTQVRLHGGDYCRVLGLDSNPHNQHWVPEHWSWAVLNLNNLKVSLPEDLGLS